MTNGKYLELNVDVQQGKDLHLHANILVLFVICSRASVRMKLFRIFYMHSTPRGQPRPRKLDARPVTDLKEHRINTSTLKIY